MSKASERRRRKNAERIQAELTVRARGRSCGACTACCTVMGVKELDKPAATRCQHECATGCAIYPTRPTTCQQYECLWLRGWGDDGMRPDRWGMLMTVEQGQNLSRAVGALPHQLFLFREVRPGALSNPSVRDQIDRLVRARNAVLVLQTGQGILYGPRFPLGRSVAVGSSNGYTAVSVDDARDSLSCAETPSREPADEGETGNSPNAVL